MKTKIDELNEAILNLRTTISSLEEKVAKEESDKQVWLLAMMLWLDSPGDACFLSHELIISCVFGF